MVGWGRFRLYGVILFALRAIYSIVIPGRAAWREPGIHTPDGGYGFRARSFAASRNDDGVVSETYRSRAGTRVILAPSAFSRSSIRS
jgi:hypothetical protein